MYESCHISDSTHFSAAASVYEGVMSYTPTSHVTHERFIAHVWMSHVTADPMRSVLRLFEWGMLHIWMSHVTHVNAGLMHESLHTYEWVWMCHEWVMLHIWIGHTAGPHMNECKHEAITHTIDLRSVSMFVTHRDTIGHTTGPHMKNECKHYYLPQRRAQRCAWRGAQWWRTVTAHLCSKCWVVSSKLQHGSHISAKHKVSCSCTQSRL